ncbi:MAG: GntR family transcriptional regulator [Methylobacteriaceae bacterium]|nr:GntR family transcriptional regulator [Methylobacteriaceae bacterium]
MHKAAPAGAAEQPMEGVARITRMTLHEAVLNQLRDMIIEGKLPPGMRINEGQVGASLGVSRTPLREAIKTLASEGLVEILPAKGAVVRRFSEGDIAEILAVLKVLEQAAARLACGRAPEAEIAAIADLHARMMQLYESGDRLAYFKLNQAIHSAIVRASGNATLAQTHEQLQARIRRIRFVGNEKPERWAGAVAEHEEMIAALVARDGDRLVEVLGRHLDQTMERVRDAVL